MDFHILAHSNSTCISCGKHVPENWIQNWVLQAISLSSTKTKAKLFLEEQDQAAYSAQESYILAN